MKRLEASDLRRGANHGSAGFVATDLGYWVATIVAAAAFAIPGAANLVRVPHIAHDMYHLGYPEYFMSILGGWKVLGAVAILAPRLPRLKEWAYAGMIFDLTGAALSRVSVGDDAITVIVPLGIAAVVIASWALRPADRRLAGRCVGETDLSCAGFSARSGEAPPLGE